MARIAGVELQDKDRLVYALTGIKGIGWSLSEKVLKSAKIADSKRVSELTTEEIAKIASALEKYQTEGDLARVVRGNVKRLQQIGSYKGGRHQRGLPARGQRTRTNARTKRGKRKTVGSFKKEELSKQQPPKEEK